MKLYCREVSLLMSWCKFVFRCLHLCWEAQSDLWAPSLGSWSCRWFSKASFVCSPQVPKPTHIVAQATVRSMAPLGGYISYTIRNTCIFQEVTSHSNTVATRWRRRKTHAKLHCRLSATRCHSPLVTSMEALLPWALRFFVYITAKFEECVIHSHPVLAWYTGCVSLTTRGTSIIHVHLFSAFLSDIIP